jgi:hypothetical protein
VTIQAQILDLMRAEGEVAGILLITLAWAWS